MTNSATTMDEVATQVPGFDEAGFRALAAETQPGVLLEKRSQAFAAYQGLPVPTVRDDEWRRTDPALIPFADFHRLPTLNPVVRPADPELDDLFDAVVSVGDDGYQITDRSGALAAGTFTVLSLQEAADKTRFVRDYLQGKALPSLSRKFEMLADAFWNIGILIHVPAGTAVEKGVLLKYNATRPNGALIPRLLLIAEDGASINVVEHLVSPDGLPHLFVSSREMYVGKNAQVKFVAAQEWGSEAHHIGEDWARVERDGRIDWITLTLGAKLSKMMLGCDVAEPNANAYMSGIFFADRDQHFDQRTLQLHSAPHTYSNLLYKGAVKDQGHSVYQGIINAKPGAIKVDAYQINNNLILSEGARADSLPGLEIDADDLKCSHGATAGTLDKEQIFYLQSRGLSRTEAEKLVVTGFFEEIIGRIPYAFIQDRLRAHVERKMGA